VFIERVLRPLLAAHPTLRVVMEHITTAQAVQFVEAAPPNVAATITAHHLLYNRSALFQGGLRPHMYCLPVLKAESHRRALLAAATSGNPKFFLGSDSAPHVRSAKEACCGCAGIYTGPATLALYAEAFESVGALDQLEGFASRHGPQFYRLPMHPTAVTLRHASVEVPAVWAVEGSAEGVVPLRAGWSGGWRHIDCHCRCYAISTTQPLLSYHPRYIPPPSHQLPLIPPPIQAHPRAPTKVPPTELALEHAPRRHHHPPLPVRQVVGPRARVPAAVREPHLLDDVRDRPVG
jgi:hypothetical protein